MVKTPDIKQTVLIEAPIENSMGPCIERGRNWDLVHAK